MCTPRWLRLQPLRKPAPKMAGPAIIVDGPESESTDFQNSVAQLRSAYPKLKFLVLNRDGKQPEMRGSLVIKKDSVLEVSSPTAQPWIDSNLALVRVEQRSQPAQIPLYTFSWGASDQGQQTTLTASDYLLAVAEAGAFHTDLLLQLDAHLQQALADHEAQAWALWNLSPGCCEVLFRWGKRAELKDAANVAVVVDQLDTGDEVMNLLARHNIPFQVVLAADLKAVKLEAFMSYSCSRSPTE